MRKLDDLLMDIPTSRKANMEKPNPKEMTAIQLVSDYNGFGVHTVLSVIRNFPNLYKNFIFASVAVVDSGSFKGAEEMKNLEEASKATLQKYVDLARHLGFAADFRSAVGTDVVETATQLCKDIKSEFHHSTVFHRQADLPPREVLSQDAAQRDGLRHPAPAALGRDHLGDAAYSLGSLITTDPIVIDITT